MRGRRFLALLGVAVCVAGEPALAGETAPPDFAQVVRARFARGTPHDTAWAAWLAAENVLREFEGEIAAQLATAAATPHATAHPLVEAVLLDAAIRLGVPVAGLDLRLLAVRNPEAVAVLATAGPLPAEQGLGLLDVLDTKGCDTLTAWVAIGNHLLTERTPGFAAWALRRVPVAVDLHVFPSGESPREGPPPPPVAHVPACGVSRLPPGMPPIPRYWISVRAGTAQDPGRLEQRVTVSRSIERGPEIGFASTLCCGPERVTVLSGWLRAASAVPFAPVVDWRHVWTGAQPWRRALQPRVDALHAAHWELVNALIGRDFLSVDEARGLEPQVHVRVFDHRPAPRRALPPVPRTRVPNPFVPRAPQAWRRPV